MRVSFFTCHRCARTRRMDLGLIGYVEFPVPSSATAAAMAFRCTAQSSRLHFAPRAPLCILATPRFLKLSVLSRGTSITRPLATSASPQSTFTWENALLAGAAGEEDEELDFRGYFEKVRNCNRGYERRSEFVPFTGEGQLLGYIHKGFLDHLSKFDDVFDFVSGEKRPYISLNPSLSSPEDRTAAVGVVIKCLGGLIPGIRNEMYPVTHAFGTPPYFSLERAAAPYFGIKAYGVHMNGYVEKDGQKFLWIGKRSDTKPTFPGMLDHLVAGGMSHGISCKDTLVKECEEEAGIPRSISDSGIPVGAVSYVDIDGPRYKRDVLFCYDLKLHDGFIPKNEDGEVQSFKLIPVSQVANIIRRTCLFKPNCSLVIMDFLFRHGFMNPDAPGYLELLQSLRRGECS